MRTYTVFDIGAAVALCVIAGLPSAAVPARTEDGGVATARPLPSSVTLRPQFERYNLPVQAQQGPNCWAYSIVGCLELELSRAAGKSVPLSAPYLVWAAAAVDGDTIDARGSNFGRAARALERYGICGLAELPNVNVAYPVRTAVSDAAIESGLRIGRNLTIEWMRFWNKPIGLNDEQMRRIKQRIADGHPVAIGMFWPKNLAVADEATCLLGTCRSLDETEDGHCVTLVGYEDSERVPGGGAFLIRNTWGPNWMSNGYARLSYQAVRKFGNDVVSFSVDSHAIGRFRPNGRRPTNATHAAVKELRAETCTSDPGTTPRNDEMAHFGKGVWQNDDQVRFAPRRVGDGLSIPIDIPRDGSYELVIAGTKGPDDGSYRFLVDGKPIGPAGDFSWPSVEPTGELRVGSMVLAKGPHALRIECVGKAPVSTGMLLGIDWVSLRPASIPGSGMPA